MCFLEHICFLHCICYLRRWIWCVSWLLHSGFKPLGFQLCRTPAQFSGREDVGCHKTNLPMRFIYLLGSGNVILIIQPAREWRCWTYSSLAEEGVAVASCGPLSAGEGCCAWRAGDRAGEGEDCRSRGWFAGFGVGFFFFLFWKTQTLIIHHLGVYIYQEHGSHAVLIPAFLTD